MSCHGLASLIGDELRADGKNPQQQTTKQLSHEEARNFAFDFSSLAQS